MCVKHSLPDIKNEVQNLIKNGHLIQENALYRVPSLDSATRAQNIQIWVDELATKGRNKTEARKYAKESIKHGRLIKSEAHYTTLAAAGREKKILQIEYGAAYLFRTACRRLF